MRNKNNLPNHNPHTRSQTPNHRHDDLPLLAPIAVVSAIPAPGPIDHANQPGDAIRNPNHRDDDVEEQVDPDTGQRPRAAQAVGVGGADDGREDGDDDEGVEGFADGIGDVEGVFGGDGGEGQG